MIKALRLFGMKRSVQIEGALQSLNWGWELLLYFSKYR